MQSLKEAAKKLTDLAAEMDGLQESLFEPIRGDCDIERAARTLRTALGKDAYFSIRPDLDFHSSGDIKVEWKIYDGKKFYEAPTLTGAVNMALAANAPQPADPVRAVEMALDPVPL